MISNSSKYSFNLPSVLKPLWNSSVSCSNTAVERNSVKFFEEAEFSLNRASSVEYLLSPLKKQIFAKKLEQNARELKDMAKSVGHMDRYVQTIDSNVVVLQKNNERILFTVLMQNEALLK
ncbi:Hypothetical_protein [Hexamita inflata]|uniref:Hypothetical_protein n=1 Tax=Hexamita inflata TaxID=28002 RepID=A0AA86UE12_9EUKA|nr:Hypothetical protein HINF_LOCUS42096 [Hexamita inflata]CAI9954460.1 Hypothetical protein HINF_LOCUS42105 [Hexamita inflata]